ncbi:hypothetical protein AVEN_239378-1 [Araneus ventricosus]|uniref:Uncharacterized protein n=1 Tax=Araneus ventricosus TaxID=182803 RepID=A0A4Y2EB23_ARAVE|nr:hypothetical protein AVEN_239378-1 [Araneus ventricosus]
MRHAKYEMTDKQTDRQRRKRINNALSSSSDLCLKFQVSSSSRNNLKKTKRSPGETHQRFTSRLRSGRLHYCKIRKVNDSDSLINLIISDKIIETSDNEVPAHVAVRQGENWLQPD